MLITLVTVAPRKAEAAVESLVTEYLKRFGFGVEARSERYRSEADLLKSLGRGSLRASQTLVLLDGGGRQFSSEQLASWIGSQRETGQSQLVFAVGPADGWSDRARAAAGLLLSLGPMTLPHELARVVIAEQVYRAFTILAGHPYHSGH